MYLTLKCQSLRGEIEVKAEIVHVFKHDAKLNWSNESLLSTFCVPYNQIRPMKDDDGLEGADIVKESSFKNLTLDQCFPPLWVAQSLLCTLLLTILPKLLESEMRLKFVMMSVGV